ncbi:MAG: dipeptide/oligopeptide/nickel ABC transporter permease/ATP-binding protein [Bacillota bacterium]|nr:dipeptide/oligopeptide/nickel ABC transporter permease/ATP-binding protein [Bacillota bacterium]
MKRRRTLPRGGRLALVLLLLLLLAVLLVPVIDGGRSTVMDPARRLQPPSAAHLFGTDNYGRDILICLFEGGRATLSIAAGTILLGCLAGLVIGALSGFFGGRVDWLLMRFNDALLSFPSILLALLFITVLGGGRWQLILAMGLMFTPSFARVVRTGFMQQRSSPHVIRVQVMGASPWRVMTVHILPLILVRLSSAIAIGLANAILTESSLSFLGLGIPPSERSWGRMLHDAQSFIFEAPWFAVFPGLIIVFTVLLAFILGSALTELRSATISPGDVPAPEVAPAQHPVVEPPADALLGIHELTLAADEEVVHGISLHVSAGEILGLVGESGSGKTMTALAVADLLPRGVRRRGGRIQIAGQNPDLLSAHARRRYLASKVGFCYQDALTALNPLLPVGRQIAESVRLTGVRDTEAIRARVLELLTKVHLAEPETVARALPHELSGGMRQRVLLAMALAAEPDLILADEPTAALDGETADIVLEELGRQREQGRGILFISHDIDIVRRLADRVAVMRHGRIVECGPTEEVLTRPQTDYTRLLLASQPSFARRGLLLGIQTGGEKP